MLIDVYATKGIDASFVSACMDVIMACGALAAVITARNYLAQYIAQEGYKIAIDLVNNLLPKIESKLLIMKKESENLDLFLKESMVRGNIYFDTADKLTRKLCKNSSELFEENELINSYLYKIATYGLKMNSIRKSNLDSIIDSIPKVDSEIYGVTTDLEEYFTSLRSMTFEWDASRNKITVIDEESVTSDRIDLTDERYLKIYNANKNILAQINNSLSEYNVITAEPRQVTKIFNV